MSYLFWLTQDQMERLRSFFPRSHGNPMVDDRLVQRCLGGKAHPGLHSRSKIAD